MIKAEELSYRYDTHESPVLRGLSLTIRDGEYVAIIGPNGCGKTTLMRHLNGLLRPAKGDVWVDGLNTKDPDAVLEIRRKVGMIFQNPDNQIVGMTVEEDVSFGPGNLGLPPQEIRRRVEASLEAVGMRHYAERAPHSLSGGEKQLVSIAGVLAMNPRYIAFDEPTSHLDPLGKKRVLRVIKALNEQGITIIHITHDMDEIVDADRIIVMNGGGILQDDSPCALFTESETLKQLGLDVPKVTDFMWRLRRMGIDIRPDILSMDDACQEVFSLIRAKAS